MPGPITLTSKIISTALSGCTQSRETGLRGFSVPSEEAGKSYDSQLSKSFKVKVSGVTESSYLFVKKCAQCTWIINVVHEWWLLIDLSPSTHWTSGCRCLFAAAWLLSDGRGRAEGLDSIFLCVLTSVGPWGWFLCGAGLSLSSLCDRIDTRWFTGTIDQFRHLYVCLRNIPLTHLPKSVTKTGIITAAHPADCHLG